MKSIYSFLLLFACSSFLQAQIVNIPDPNFKAALLADQTFVNTNGDNEIQLSEAQACIIIDLNNKGITDLTGIEEFVNLIIFDVADNNITSIDLTPLDQIVEVRANDNQLTSITLPLTDTALIEIYLQNNQLTSVTLPNKLGDLERLNLSYNQLDSLDLSNVTANTRFNKVQHNQLTHITLPPNNKIYQLNCSHNLLTKLDLAQPVGGLNCGNNFIDSLWIPAQSGSVRCDSNQLVFIDVPGDLDTLICHHNQITELDGTSFDPRYINCSYNNIDSLTTSGVRLAYLNISHNQLNRLGIFNPSNDNAFPLNASNNSALECIETNRSTTLAASNWTLDSQTSVSNDCQGIWSSIFALDDLPNISLYPNPTSSNQVLLDLGQWYQQASISIYNSLGQVLNNLSLENTQYTELILPKNTGIYLIKIQTPKGQAVLKVVKE